MSFCANCGQKNDDTSKFCFNCGNPLTAEPPVNTPVVDEAPQPPYTEETEATEVPEAVTEDALTKTAEGAFAPEIPPEVYPPHNEVYPPHNEGTYQPPVKKKKSKTPIIVAAAIVAILLVVAAVLVFTHTICLFHEYSEPTCEEAAICTYCEKEGESALGHAWAEATCTAPKTCTRCQISEGDMLPHTWKAATCVAPKICENCSVAEGEALGHEWQGGSCTEAGTCVRCGIEADEPVGHIDGEWVTENAATLMNGGTERLICANCDAILDVRIIDAKEPAVNGMSFNFTEEEFVEWLEGYLGFTIEYDAYNEVYSFTSAAGGYTGDLAFECDTEGYVSAIGILTDEAATSIGIAMGFAGEINPVFYYDNDDILAVYNGDFYTDALMTVGYDDSEGMCVSVLGTEEWFSDY